MSAKDLQAPLPPPEQNAAPLYVQLTNLLKTRPLTQEDKVAEDISGYRALSSEQIALLRRALAHRPEVLRLIHRAATRPKCVFQRDWSLGPAVLFPELARMREGVRWLSAESALQLHDGKPMAAIHTMTLGFRLARQATTETTLTAFLISLAIDAITLRGLERILYMAGDKPGVAEAVRQVIVKDRQPCSLAHALCGEIAIQILIINALRAGDTEKVEAMFGKDENFTSLTHLSSEGKQLAGLVWESNGARLLEMTRKLIHIADRPFPEADEAANTMKAELELKKSDLAYQVAPLFAPAVIDTIPKRAISQAKAEVLRTAATLLLWKAKQGAFPATLQEVMKPVPTDPFDGKPLRYKQEGNGFVVYSIGATGQYDGGSPFVRPASGEAVFRYPMPDWMQNAAPLVR